MVKISSIKKLGIELTVDIEVENTHTYQLSNGWVSHNTVSALVNSASGIHRRHSPFYIRTVRSDKKDPLSQLMIDQGVYHEDDQMRPNDVYVFSFPLKSPNDALYRADATALDQLELWLLYQKYWADHKPSITVSVKENEWLRVGSWVFDNFEWMSGVSFLPSSDHSYTQAPFQEINKEEYEGWCSKTPQIDWAKLSSYEKVDMTTSSQEMACSGNCELV